MTNLKPRQARAQAGAFEWRSKRDLKRGTTTTTYGPVKFVHTPDRFRLYWYGRLTVDIPQSADLAIVILSLIQGAKAEVDYRARREGQIANAQRTNAKRSARDEETKRDIVEDEIRRALVDGTPDDKIVTIAWHNAIAKMKKKGIAPRRGAAEVVSERYVRRIKREMLG